MNRYIVRGLVALLTFGIGVVVGGGLHRTRHEFEVNCFKSRVRMNRPFEVGRHSFSGPFVSIDTTQADPVKLAYSSTTTDQTTTWRQRLEFLVNKNSPKAVANYTVSYQSSWGRYREPNTIDVLVRPTAGLSESETFSLECGTKETVTVWVSKVEFKDGTQWENPRHRVGQSNL
jgi:hypothetical protein